MRLLIACLALCLAACQVPLPAAIDMAPVMLEGRAEFPAFAVQAVSNDVLNRATVSLIDIPSGDVRVAGVTDATGLFRLYQPTMPFAPVDGTFYYLDASKPYTVGLGVKKRLSLRTVLKREAGRWTSITGPNVFVNLTTSTLAKVAYRDTIPWQAIMGVVSGTTGTHTTIAGAVGTHGLADLAQRVTLLTDVLDLDTDPVNRGKQTIVGDFEIGDGPTLVAFADVATITGIPPSRDLAVAG